MIVRAGYAVGGIGGAGNGTSKRRRAIPTASCATRGGRHRRPEGQCEQPRAWPASSAVRKLEPQPQPETAFGLLTVKPAPMSVST